MTKTELVGVVAERAGTSFRDAVRAGQDAA